VKSMDLFSSAIIWLLLTPTAEHIHVIGFPPSLLAL